MNKRNSQRIQAIENENYAIEQMLEKEENVCTQL